MRRLFVDDVIPPNSQRPLRPFTAHCQAAGTPVGICKSETVKWWNAPSRMAVIHALSKAIIWLRSEGALTSMSH